MAEAVVCSVPPSRMFSDEMLGGKRKTPSELRSEQLKRLQNDQNQAFCSSDSNQVVSVLRKHDVSKPPPRFVDSRVPDIYAVTKPGDRFNKFSVNEKKDPPACRQKCGEQANEGMDVTTVADRARSLAKFQWKKADEPDHTDCDTGATPFIPAETDKKSSNQSNPPLFNTFRNVTQLSTGIQCNTSVPSVDMVKAFKGMSASRVLNSVEQTVGAPCAADTLQTPLVSNTKGLSICVRRKKLPLDLTLKTNIRFMSNASFERCQRMTNKDLYTGMQSFLSASHSQGDFTAQINSGDILSSKSAVEAFFAEALLSWTHPQSVLPSSVLSTLASSAAHGGTAEKDFLAKRQLAWEDSFRSLYYMFRDGQCDIFYFATQQFFVMFIRGEFCEKGKKDLNAYITRSTRGLRALLQEQDVAFTMPLCSTEMPTSFDEIQELTEFEKSHPGQTRLVDSMVAVDNGPQSVLAFSGQNNVHGLYDFLLNHRSLLRWTTGADVPSLYSPVSFQNACLVMPEVLCQKFQRPSDMCKSSHEQANPLSMNTSFTLEIRGSVLPPWVVWRVCVAIQKLQPGNFEASLVTDPLSAGLNIAQDYAVTDFPDEEAGNTSLSKKELNTILVSPDMKVGFMKHFKLEEGSYTVTLSPV